MDTSSGCAILKKKNTLSNGRNMHFTTGGAITNILINDCLNTLLTYVMNRVYNLFFSHDIMILNGQKRIVHNLSTPL